MVNSLIYQDENDASYFDNYETPLVGKQSVTNLIINKTVNGKQVQNHFEILRTNEGYKLISVTIRNQKLIE